MKKLGILFLLFISIILVGCGNTISDDGTDNNNPNSGVVDDNESNHRHTLHYYSFNAATCTEEGNIEYWYCSGCNKYFSNVEGTNEIELSDTVIDALGHTPAEAVRENETFSTCTTEGSYDEVIYCSVCGEVLSSNSFKKPISNHTLQHYSAIPATCTESGKIEYWKCSVCDKYFSDEACTIQITLNETTVSPLNHDYVDGICSRCGSKGSVGLEYTLYKNDILRYYSVSGIGTCEDTDIYIPDFYNGLPVNRIEDSAFSGCSSLTSIEIPSNLYIIGNSAFKGCTSLVSIKILSNIGYIVDSMFEGCTSLENINIPSDINEIGHKAFSGCSSLKSIEIPSSVRLIGEYAFNECTSLESINIPAIVTDIKTKTFYNCSNLKTITFEENSKLTDIHESAFEGCTSLDNINIPESVTDIKTKTFYNCSNLTMVTFGENIQLEDISPYTFSGCSSLTSIEIPASVTSIYWNAFEGCTSLETITIPSSVTSISQDSFDGCNSLSNIHYLGNATDWVQIEGLEDLMKYGSSIKNLYLNGEFATDIVIEEGTTSIPSYAFSNCVFITNITIPASVTSIGTYAFYKCNSLSIVFYQGDVNNCLKIEGLWNLMNFSSSDKYLYLNGNLVTDVIIEEVTSIPGSAFSGCSSLESVVIPSTVTSIGYCAFQYCNSLSNIYYQGDVNNWLKIEGLSDLMSFSSSDKYLYLNDILVTDVIIEEVTSIPGSAFHGCSSLESVVIPSTVTAIGMNTFYNCSNLKTVTFGENSQLNSIEEGAFYECSSLESIEIPSAVTAIEMRTFYNCSNLKTVTFGENSQLNSIGFEAFCECSSLESIVIPSTVTIIEYGAFYGCSSLTSINIPSTVTSIGGYAFFYCSSLTSIVIPASVESIGEDAFHGCSSNLTIYCEATSQPEGWDINWNFNYDENYNEYKITAQWGYTGN